MELTPEQAEKEWRTGRYRPVYYLFGEDAEAKAEFVSRLKELLRPDSFNLDEIADPNAGPGAAVGAAQTQPVFADRRLVVVRGTRLGAEAKRLLAEYLGCPLETTTLVLSSEERKPDIRDVLAAAAAARQGLVVFKPLKEDEARRRLQEGARKAGSSIDGPAADLLIDEAGTQWGTLQAELAKLLLFARGRPSITREDVLACLGARKGSSPFDLQRHIETRDRTKALTEVHRSLEDGMEPLALLNKVVWALNRQLKARRLKAAGKSDGEIFSALRLQSYYDRDYLKQLARLGEPGLVAALKACIELDTRLKSESWLDGGVELERLVAALCRPRRAQAAAATG